MLTDQMPSVVGNKELMTSCCAPDHIQRAPLRRSDCSENLSKSTQSTRKPRLLLHNGLFQGLVKYACCQNWSCQIWHWQELLRHCRQLMKVALNFCGGGSCKDRKRCRACQQPNVTQFVFAKLFSRFTPATDCYSGSPSVPVE